MPAFVTHSAVEVIGVPMDFGAGRRGVNMGPSAIRLAGLHTALETMGCEVIDSGDVAVPLVDSCRVSEPELRYIDCIIPVARRLVGKVASSVRKGRFALVIGGDHSLSLGSARGAARGRKLGLIWIDAHADFNTHLTTPSGNIHGMPLAALTGWGDPRLVGLNDTPRTAYDPAHVVVIGARDLDAGEKDNLRRAGVTVMSMTYVDRYGMSAAVQRAIEIAGSGTEGVYLSFDMDAIDPIYAPGVGTPVQGGLTYREAHLACEMLAESGLLVGMDVVEVNPILDVGNKTAALAVELILSALGKQIF